MNWMPYADAEAGEVERIGQAAGWRASERPDRPDPWSGNRSPIHPGMEGDAAPKNPLFFIDGELESRSSLLLMSLHTEPVSFRFVVTVMPAIVRELLAWNHDVTFLHLPLLPINSLASVSLHTTPTRRKLPSQWCSARLCCDDASLSSACPPSGIPELERGTEEKERYLVLPA
jgi:hypothetical protein